MPTDSPLSASWVSRACAGGAKEDAIDATEPREDQLQEAQTRVVELEQEVNKESQDADRLQCELVECHQRFHELVQHLHQVFWIVEAPSDRLLYVSPAYHEIWGRTCDSLYADNHSWIEAVHDEDRERVRGNAAKKHEAGQYEIEYRIVRPDGSIRWIWDRGYGVRNEQGEIDRFVGVSQDITARKVAEERNATLVAIIECADDSIVCLTLEGIVISWNRGAERLYGYTADEMIGESILLIHPPGEHEEHDMLIASATRGERVAAFETVRRRKDGALIEVSLSASAIEVLPGHVTGLTKVSHDVSQIKRLENQFRQAQKMEAVGTLAGGVAHDFNNLLTVINGYSTLAIDRLHADDPLREMLDEIHKAGTKAAALTGQLLAFSRKQVLEPKVLNLNAVVTETQSLLHRLIGEDVILTTTLDPKLKPVKVDPGQIQQVMMNLAVNARDAMPQGGRLSIQTQNASLDETYRQTHPEVQPGDYSMLVVTDEGTGMDVTTQSHMFEPFFTTKEAGKGTGLGLAVVHGVVKQSGGHIEVYSESGRGTAFKMYFPQVQEPLSTTKAPFGNGSMPTGNETLLLVEDEAAVRALARHVLRSCGYEVLEAGDGREAIQVALRYDRPIHLVVTDVVMPHLGGHQMAEQLEGTRPGTRFLFLSGYTADAVFRHGILQSEVAFLQKPFTPMALSQKVRTVLDETRRQVSDLHDPT